MGYEFTKDGRVAIKLNEGAKVGINHDICDAKIPGKNSDPSLSYFVVINHRIVASGDFTQVDDNYVCNGAFRVYSKITVPIFSYTGASQVSLENLDYLNGKMLEATKRRQK